MQYHGRHVVFKKLLHSLTTLLLHSLSNEKFIVKFKDSVGRGGFAVCPMKTQASVLAQEKMQIRPSFSKACNSIKIMLSVQKEISKLLPEEQDYD